MVFNHIQAKIKWNIHKSILIEKALKLAKIQKAKKK